MKKNFLIIAVFIGATLFNSCNNVEQENVFDTEEGFLSALNLFSDNFFATPVSHGTNNAEVRRANGLSETANFETIFLNVSSEVTPSVLSEFENIRTMEDVSVFTERTGATIEFEPIGNNVQFQLEFYTGGIEMGLNSLVSDAKQYLFAIGYKEQQIQEMLINHEVQKMLIDNDLPELALIHFATVYQLESLVSSSLNMMDCMRDCDEGFIIDVNLAGIGFAGGLGFCLGPHIKACAGFVTVMWMVGVGRAHHNHRNCRARC